MVIVDRIPGSEVIDPAMSDLVRDHAVFEKARRSRDARFDGRFFVGVNTTGIYCRPVCPVRLPSADHVDFFITAAAAEEHGFRPCFRCRPETAPGTPAWRGVSTTVARAMWLISEGALDDGSVPDLAARLGVGERHLSRLFTRYLGASPISVAQTRRLQFAKQLIDGSDIKFSDIALSSGYRSVRRFNAHVSKVYGMSPRDLRRRSKSGNSNECGFAFKLAYRPPLDWSRFLDFQRIRAVPGVEAVADNSYSRTIVTGEGVGFLSVENVSDRSYLSCRLASTGAATLFTAVERLKRLFDLYADPLQIRQDLMRSMGEDDPAISLIRTYPGIRVPGCWDPFEIAVRAVVGQQISVKAASTVMAGIVDRYGPEVESPLGSQLSKLFPAPEILARLEVDELPMPARKARTIRELAERVASGQLNLEDAPQQLLGNLTDINGIGDWTAQYIAMRAGNDPDAFPSNDLVLLKSATRLYKREFTHKDLTLLAEQWRPWRAYMVMKLWRYAVDSFQTGTN